MKNIKVLKRLCNDGDVAIITEKVEDSFLNEFHRRYKYEMEQRVINRWRLKTRYDQIEELKNQTRQII